MTEIEAKGFLQGKLDCMKKCSVFNVRDNGCDNCEYCYSQGNFGNQKEALRIAINTLEKQIERKKMKCKVVADNGQTLLRNLMLDDAIKYANNMKKTYPKDNFFVIKQE